jgi:hypothetical protein
MVYFHRAAFFVCLAAFATGRRGAAGCAGSRST